MYKLYIGNETHISLNHAKAMVKELLKEKEYEYISLDGEKTDSTQIIEVVSCSSLFTSSRVIFLKRVYKNKNRDTLIPFLLEHFEKDSKDSFIIWEDQKISAITKYVKYFKAKQLLEEYNKLNKNTFKTYARDKCKEYNINLDTELLNLLSKYSNFDTERFENNLKKLKLLEKEEITKEDIKSIVEDTLEDDIWQLLDEMNSIDGKPLDTLENILNQGIDPKYIFPMIFRNLRLITLTKYMTSINASYSEIASVLRIPPFTVKPLIEASTKYDWDKIRNKYEKLSNLDYEIKIGRINPKLGLTLFCTTV